MTLYIIVGPSGSGKTTLQRTFENYGACGVVSTTSRPMRDGEVDGFDYHFKTVPEFEQMIESGEFIEHVKFGGNYYGVGEDSILSAIQNGKNNIAVLVTEIYGYQEIKKADYGQFDVKGIFLNANKGILIERLKNRAGTTPEFLEKRIPLLDVELSNIELFREEIILDSLSIEQIEQFVDNSINGEALNRKPTKSSLSIDI